MNQVILFSPVGGTDPIAMANCQDGSLLHICRVYRPSKVILYMSKEILENQAKDDRYRYCLNQLAKKQNRKMEYEIIERADLRNVQEYDYFYQDFREIISRVCESMEDGDSLLLNVSSGTPAMKSGLLVLQTLGEFPCKMIQVSTPAKGMNEHVHKDYDVYALWQHNKDNKEGFENRCHEVSCPTLTVIKREEIIKKHISVYDYQAAMLVAQTLLAEHTEKYFELLRMAEARLLLDLAFVDKVLRKRKDFRLPVAAGGGRVGFEYALILEVKLKRREYADFIRAITPLFVDLLELVLKKQCKINIDDFTAIQKKWGKEKRPGQNIRKWDKNKLYGTQVLAELQKGYGMPFKYGYISSDHLRILIEAFSEDTQLKVLVKELRQVEENIRNLAAHQIVSITEKTIRELTGFTGKQIMDKIKAMFSYTDMNLQKGCWKSYDEMNQLLLKSMEK